MFSGLMSRCTTASVRVTQRVGNLACDAKCFINSELFVAIDPVTQRLAFDQRHHVVKEGLKTLTAGLRLELNFARVIQRNDVRMAEIGCGLDFEQKPFGAQRGPNFRTKNLDGDIPVVLQVAREIQCSHAAAAELALDGVAACERD